MTKRRKFSDKFKATVALEALRGDRTVQEIAAKHRVHPTQVTPWKRQAIEGLTGVFSDKVNHYRLRPVASRLECNSRYCMMISSVTFPDVVEKYPRAQNRLPQ